MASDALLTVQEAAGIIGKSPRTIQRMAERGDLPFVRKLPGHGTNGRYVFDRSAIELYALRRQLAKAAAS